MNDMICERGGVKRSELTVGSLFPQSYETFKQQKSEKILIFQRWFMDHKIFISGHMIDVRNKPNRLGPTRPDQTRPGPTRPDPNRR